MGTYRNGSDIDLTLMGEISVKQLFEIENKLDDLLLPYKIDLSKFEGFPQNSSGLNMKIVNLERRKQNEKKASLQKARSSAIYVGWNEARSLLICVEKQASVKVRCINGRASTLACKSVS